MSMTRFGSDWHLFKRWRDKYERVVRFGVTASRASPLPNNSAEKETPMNHSRIFVQIFTHAP